MTSFTALFNIKIPNILFRSLSFLLTDLHSLDLRRYRRKSYVPMTHNEQRVTKFKCSLIMRIDCVNGCPINHFID